MKAFVAGIDGGGSKTEALLVEVKTGETKRFISGGMNALTDDSVVSQANLQEIMKEIKHWLASNQGCLASICLGSASMVREDEQDWEVKLIADFFPQAQIQGVADGRIALIGALDGSPGVIVVAGTGSVAYALDEAGILRRCGGFGPIFGDEGSGYAIGRDALQAVAMDLDGRGESTLLTGVLQQRLSFESEESLIEKVYGEMSRKQIAALAQEVGICAQKNDPVSLRILDHAAKQLAVHYLRLLAQSHWSVPPPLSYAGGVFQMGGSILRPLEHYLGSWAERLIPPKHTPVYGAVRLAKQALGDVRCE
ncbi:N-acetylglucosamine kinase-like BadF-type ATPase [Paenibacillus qinlingensis]|uniref:N-acetylglucosamine kinase-like BadF-type ATPase n=1 Tax=Paenibacillus qinlingensis TaxID=1837343 RepID=A0ABU1NNY0_9BACL|nr:N-acetylglucosamine kinase-like BadF-type ATPase [Paenibacillus qinlingensis]